LVPRTCPALEKKRAAGKEKSKQKAAKKTQKAREPYMHQGVDLEKLMKRLCRLKAWEGAFYKTSWVKKDGKRRRGKKTLRVPKLTIHRYTYEPGRGGFARYRTFEVHLNLTPTTPMYDAVETLIHEMAHLAAGPRDSGHKHHSTLFRGFLAQAIEEYTGIRVNASEGACWELDVRCKKAIQESGVLEGTCHGP